MAFGQASGPPASAKQVEAITELLAAAGYDSLREARHPFGLTQRQANGKFTRDEADELLARLEAEGEGAVQPDEPDEPPAVPRSRPRPRAARAPAPPRATPPRPMDVVTAFPDELLADELARRGWTCTPPP